MTKMSILTELMVCHKGVKLGGYYYIVRMCHMCGIPKWIYFGFIAIYVGFMTRIHFLP